MVCVTGIEEASLVDDALVFSHRHEGAVKMEDALVGVCVALSEVEGDDPLSREDHLEVIQRQAVCTGGLYLRIILKGILAKEDVIVVQHHVSAFHVNGFRKVVDVLVVDLPVDAAVGVNLLLAVRDYVGDNYFVVNHKSHVTGEHLVAVRHKVRPVNSYVVLFEDTLKGVHLLNDILFFRVHSVEYALIGLAVKGLVQGGGAAI